MIYLVNMQVWIIFREYCLQRILLMASKHLQTDILNELQEQSTPLLLKIINDILCKINKEM